MAAALMNACLDGNVPLVRSLSQKDPSLLYERDACGWTALHITVKRGFPLIAKILIEAGADIHSTNHGWSSLYQACCTGNIDMIQLLLEYGAKVDHADEEDGQTPLYEACSMGNLQVVELLLNNGANIHHSDWRGWSPLHIACFRGHYDIVERLLEAGSRTEQSDRWNETPLFLACRRGNLKTIELLLSYKANLHHVNAKHNTPLLAVCETGLMDVAQYLLSKGASAPHGSLKRTTLHQAVVNDNAVALASLLSLNIDIVSDGEGNLPLHLVKSSVCCEALLSRAEDGLRHKNQKGLVPFQEAALNKDTPVDILMQLLLAKPTFVRSMREGL